MLALGSYGGGGARVALTRNGDGTVTARIGGASTGTLAYSIDGAAWVVVEDATLPYTIPGVGAGNAVEAVGSAAQSLSPTAFDVLLNARLTSGRVDFVGLGDSNQLLSGYGWDHGIQYALDQSFPMYATGLISCNDNNGDGSGIGYGYRYNSSGPILGAVTGAPTDLHDYLDAGAGGLDPHDYGYLASGTFAWGDNTGLILSTDCPLDVSDDLSIDYHIGTFTTGTGAFSPAIRLNSSPFTQLEWTDTVTNNTGSYGMTIETLSLPGGSVAVGTDLNARWTAVARSIASPFFGLYIRAHSPNQTTGWSYHTLNARGGESTRTMAYDLQEASDTTLSYFFGECRRLQGATKTVVICINEGLNDRNETLASVGPGAVSDGDSPEAYVDNHTAIVNRIKAIWTLNGWSQDELFWLFMPSHPVSNPDDAELLSYRTALATYAGTLSQATVVDLESLTDADAMLAAGYYASGGSDRSHLTQSGYEDLGVSIIGAAT